MSFIKENGGPLVIGAVVLTLLAGYVELRAPQMIGTEMDSRGLVSTETVNNIENNISAVAKDVAEQKETHNRDADRMDGKIERIVDILLED